LVKKKSRHEHQWIWYEYTQLCASNFWHTWQKHMMVKRQPFKQMLLGKPVICLQKTETSFMPVTLCKYQLNVD
jgi:hypothetical protein